MKCSIFTLQALPNRLEASIQDTVHLGDGYSVVDDGNTCFYGRSDSPLHLLIVQHTATAVNDKIVGGKVGRKIPA